MAIFSVRSFSSIPRSPREENGNFACSCSEQEYEKCLYLIFLAEGRALEITPKQLSEIYVMPKHANM